MEENKLHIVSFSIPYPPDYGGAIDVFFKLKALHEIGLKIILHCFVYKKRYQSAELNKYCDAVYYYDRETKFTNNFSKTPYIVKSRESEELLERLKKDNYPILFEGIHTTAYLNHPALEGRIKWVRAHNIERDYYTSLSKAEKFNFKKLYFQLEAWKLKKYEETLKYASGIFAISSGDAEGLKKINPNTFLVSAFHGFTKVLSKPGHGNYLLYHGDLSVPENSRCAENIIDICKDLEYKLIIAGKEPDDSLISLIKQYRNIELIQDPDSESMENMIKDAGVILLPANQTTGLRLKLLISLFIGRFCIASPQMVKNTGLEKLCLIAETKNEWRPTIKNCMKFEFTELHAKQREEPLKKYLDTEGAKKIKELIFDKK